MATMDEVKGWLAGRLPKDWFTGTPDVRMDEDEIWVIGTLPEVPATGGAEAGKAATREQAERAEGAAQAGQGEQAAQGEPRPGPERPRVQHIRVS